MITGQEKICRLIDTSTLDDFPRSLMLVGESGSGKHLLCDYIASKFSLRVLDITSTLDQETIEEIYNRVEPYLYIIKINEVSVKEENTILKFLEEPLKNSFIVLIAETDVGILQTILNRCQIWYLQNYSKEFLKTFLKSGNEFILEVAHTPGRIQYLEELQEHISFSDMIDLADKIIDKIEIASISNTLTLSGRVSFKNEDGKFDGKLFVDILISRLRKKWLDSSDIRYVSAYNLTSKLNKDMHVTNLDHKSLFERYLIELRHIMKGTLV